MPVHVLDVGNGEEENSEWLLELADDSDGTYSYVPTAMSLGGWINENMPEGTFNGDPLLDTDGDGVPNWVEIHGATNTNSNGPSRVFGNPSKADTDDDGVPDGIQFGRRVVGQTGGITSGLYGTSSSVRRNRTRNSSTAMATVSLTARNSISGGRR